MILLRLSASADRWLSVNWFAESSAGDRGLNVRQIECQKRDSLSVQQLPGNCRTTPQENDDAHQQR